MPLPCQFNWHEIIAEQLYSFDRHPAKVIEVRHNQNASTMHWQLEIEKRDLSECTKFWSFDSKDSIEAARNFPDGSGSFVFLDCEHTYQATLDNLNAWYRVVHFNSAMAGHGIRIPEVRKAIEDFCKEKRCRWRIINECWQINHCHTPGQIVD